MAKIILQFPLFKAQPHINKIVQSINKSYSAVAFMFVPALLILMKIVRFYAVENGQYWNLFLVYCLL